MAKYAQFKNNKIVRVIEMDFCPPGFCEINENSQEILDYQNNEGKYAVSNYFESRMNEYGTIEEQIEFIVENGFAAFIRRQKAIKEKYPKS